MVSGLGSDSWRNSDTARASASALVITPWLTEVSITCSISRFAGLNEAAADWAT